jgi:hypothetical protein
MWTLGKLKSFVITGKRGKISSASRRLLEEDVTGYHRDSTVLN